MNASCQCSKPMTNAADFCARCGRPVHLPPSVLLCKPDEVERVRGLATMEAQRVHVDEVGRVWLPPVNATPPELSITIGLAEAGTGPTLTSGTLARRGEHSDIVITAGHRQTTEQTFDVVAILEAMPNGHRQMALAAIKKRFELSEVSERMLKLEEDTNCTAREILALLRKGTIAL